MERLTAISENGKAYYPYCFREDTCDGCGSSEKCDQCELSLKVCETLAAYENTGLTPEQIRELKGRDKPKRVVYEHGFEDSRLIYYVQRCKSCGEQYDPSEKFNFRPNCGQRILRRKVIVKAFANYGFAGTEMEFEEEFPDNATDEEIEETMKDIVYEQVDWSWKKED